MIGGAGRIDDPPQQCIADGHVHDPAGAFDFIARVQVLVVAKQYDADIVFVDIEGYAEHIAGEAHQFLEADAGQTANPGDARGDGFDNAHLAWCKMRCVSLSHLTYSGKGTVENVLEVFLLCGHCFIASGSITSATGSSLFAGLLFSFRSSFTAFSSDAR
jgi:hypothetical protein